MLLNLFVLQRNCKKETFSHRMIHRSTNNLCSVNSTKYKVIPSYLNKFINCLMVDGKKAIAVEIFAESLQLFSRKLQEGKETPLLIKNQHLLTSDEHQSYSKNQAFLLDGRYRAPTFALKHQMGYTFKSALQSCFDSIKYPFFLQRPGANLLGLAFCSPFCSSLLIKDEQMLCKAKQRHKTNNNGLRQRVREKTILLGKQHHFRKSNTPSPSLINCLEQALINIEPSLEVRKKKIAGITRQIPSTLSKSRGQGLAIRWIVESARGRRRKEGKRFSECLADELVDAYHKKGEPRQKRDALHKLAESNRSFLRYRWW